MRRREFITLVGGAAAWPLAVRAQQPPGRIRRIGVLVALAKSDPESQLRISAFRQGLEQLGWFEGRNVEIDDRWQSGDAEAFRTAAAELVGMKPDVIFAGNKTAVLALQKAGNKAPTVFVQVADPVAAGFVVSLAQPGGSMTGFALFEFNIARKWVELLREIAPHTARISVIYDPASAALGFLPYLESALPPGMRLTPSLVHNQSELEESIKQTGGEPNGALVVLAGPLPAIHRDLIVALAVKYGLPLIYPYRYFTAAGGLMSYGPDTVDQYRVAAGYVDRILNGEKPADMPVQFPTRYQFVVNLKTAKALGLSIPQTLLATADEVIE